MNSFDYLILVLLVISAFSGYKAGLIQTVFRTVGYIAGGVIGVAVAIDYLDSLNSEIYLLGGLVLSVIIFALFGEFLLGRLGLLADKYITPSKSYTYADTHLPKVAMDLKQEVVQLFNRIS